MALLTAERARGYLAATTNGSADPELSQLCEVVSRAFARICGYPGRSPTMEPADYVRYVDGRGGRDLVVDVAPLISVTEIRDDATLDWTDDTYLVDAADYAIVAPSDDAWGFGLVRLTSTSAHGAWSTRTGAIRVTCRAGWTEIPEDLADLAGRCVRHLYDLRQTQGKRSISPVPGGNISYDDPAWLPPWALAGLGSYRLLRSIA